MAPVQVGDQRFGAVNVSDSFRFFGCTDCRQDRGVADVAGFDADAVFELSDEVVVISAFQRPYATVDANQRGAEGTASASRLCRAAAACVVCLDAACPLPCLRGILPCFLCRFVAVLFTAECSGRNLVQTKLYKQRRNSRRQDRFLDQACSMRMKPVSEYGMTLVQYVVAADCLRQILLLYRQSLPVRAYRRHDLGVAYLLAMKAQ